MKERESECPCAGMLRVARAAKSEGGITGPPAPSKAAKTERT